MYFRLGTIFRGDIAKNLENAGAVGAIMYRDPKEVESVLIMHTSVHGKIIIKQHWSQISLQQITIYDIVISIEAGDKVFERNNWRKNFGASLLIRCYRLFTSL